MGKGDKKSKRGKIVLGTYGVRRRRKTSKKSIPPVSAPIKEKAEEKVGEKAEVKVKAKAEAKAEPKSAPAKRKTKTAAPPKPE